MTTQFNQTSTSFSFSLSKTFSAIMILGALVLFAAPESYGQQTQTKSNLIGRWQFTKSIMKDGKVIDMTVTKGYEEFGGDGVYTDVIGEGADQITQKGRYGTDGDRLTIVIEAGGKSYSTVYTMHIDGDGKTLTLINDLATQIYKRL